MRVRLAAAAAALVVVVLAVVLLTGGSDDEIRLQAGAPRDGFPLRGDLAKDTELQRGAAEAWRKRATRDGGSWAGEGDPVEVLWAGKLADDHVGVVLKADFETAFLVTDEQDEANPYWNQTEGVLRRIDPPLVAFGSAVLAPEGAEATFHPAQQEGDGSPPVQEDLDGLWTRGDVTLPEGTLLIGGDRPVAAFTGDVPVVNELSEELWTRLSTGDASRVGGPAQRLVAAARAGATAPLPGVSSRLELVADMTVAPFGPVTVVGTRFGASRPLLSAGVGEARAAGEDLVGVRLGGGDVDGRTPDGPAFGGAYVRLGEDGAPYLLVAGDLAGAEVRTGRERVAVATPVGAVRATWLQTDAAPTRLRTDTAILGRTATGAVVVPDVAPDLQTIG